LNLNPKKLATFSMLHRGPQILEPGLEGAFLRGITSNAKKRYQCKGFSSGETADTNGSKVYVLVMSFIIGVNPQPRCPTQTNFCVRINAFACMTCWPIILKNNWLTVIL
jgi:hypothetical protein